MAHTEADPITINGLVARHGWGRLNGMTAEGLFAIERELLVFDFKLNNEVGPPNPHAPPGGTALALRVA